MKNLNNTKPHYNEVDVARAIGIFLVVLGHSFPDASSSNGIQYGGWRFVFYLIYSFHMPLFVFLSGVVVGSFSNTNRVALNNSIKKIKRLMVPYLTWGLLYIPFRLILVNYSSASFDIGQSWRLLIGENPYSGLWFLYALFFVSIIYIWIIRNEQALSIALVISFIMLLFAKYVFIIEPIKWIFLYSFYYLLGVFVRNSYRAFLSIINHRLINCGAIILFATLFLMNYFWDYYLSGVVSVIIALCGIYIVYGVSYKLKGSKLLTDFGIYGMDIFILSGPILVVLRIVLFRILNMNYSIYVVVSTFLGFLCPLIISKSIIRKNKMLKKLLLGMWE